MMNAIQIEEFQNIANLLNKPIYGIENANEFGMTFIKLNRIAF